IARRMTDSGWAFVRRAGTLILAAMIVVWALLYFPRTEVEGQLVDVQLAGIQEQLTEQDNEIRSREKEVDVALDILKNARKPIITDNFKLFDLGFARGQVEAAAKRVSIARDEREKLQAQIDDLHGEWKRQSYLGRMGKWIEPAVKPLGWDWKIG